MKKVIYLLFLPLVVVSGLLFANRQVKEQPSEKPVSKPISAAEREAALKAWEATPEGIKYKTWEASPIGVQVLAGAAKIREHVKDSSTMEAVVTSLSLPPGSRLGFGVMARIDGVDYILTFDADKSQFAQLQSLKINDKLVMKAHGVSFAPKYAYPIVSCAYAEREGKQVYKRVPPKGGC